jgi:hypothetical protein
VERESGKAREIMQVERMRWSGVVVTAENAENAERLTGKS